MFPLPSYPLESLMVILDVVETLSCMICSDVVAVFVVWMPCSRDRDGQRMVPTVRTALGLSQGLRRETVSAILCCRSVDSGRKFDL